jgi:hypothetical protein
VKKRFEDHLCLHPQGTSLFFFFAAQPFEPADSLRELHRAFQCDIQISKNVSTTISPFADLADIANQKQMYFTVQRHKFPCILLIAH